MPVDRSSRVRRLRTVPIDLTLILAVTILVNVVVFAPIIRSSAVRVPLGFLFVFFVPGYVLVATLFPEASRSVTETDLSETSNEAEPLVNPSRTEIDGLERIVLSFGASVAIVPGLALLLHYTPWGIRPVSVLAASTVVTLFLTITATVRRFRLSEVERFRITVPRPVATLRAEVSKPADRAEMVITALLVVSVLLAAGGIGYAVTTSSDGERFSAVYLLGEDENGELVADEYPTEFEPGESQELVIGIDNREHKTTTYTVVAVEQEVESDSSEPFVSDQREIDRFEIRLDHGETWHQDHDIEPMMADENRRIVWLVYLDGDVPDDPSTENARYHVHLWITGDELNGNA